MAIVNGHMDEPGYNESKKIAAHIKDINLPSNNEVVKSQLEIELETIQERTLEEEAELRASRVKNRANRKAV